MAGLQPDESQTQTNLFKRTLESPKNIGIKIIFMKKQLTIYVVIILAFVAYNQFFQVQDERINSVINILFASFLFLYIGFVAYSVLKKLKDTGKK